MLRRGNPVELRLADEHAARLRAFVARDDPAALEHVDQSAGTRVADAQAPLDERDGCRLCLDDDFDPDEDPLLDKAIEIVVTTQTASVSLIQRRLRVGYTRAGRLIDMLERRGIISGYEGSKPRRVLVDEAELPRVIAN